MKRLSDEHRRKIREGLRGNTNAKGKKMSGRGPLSEEHRRAISEWAKLPRTDSPTDKTIHGRLNRAHPKTGVCEECGATGRRTSWCFTRHPEPYTQDIADYRELCDPCHARFDGLSAKGSAQRWKR